MKNLAIKTQNAKGNEPKYKENYGFCSIFTSPNSCISVDNFEGFGESYKKRNEPLIIIKFDDVIHFKGTEKELVKILTSKKITL